MDSQKTTYNKIKGRLVFEIIRLAILLILLMILLWYIWWIADQISLV